ncbi:hypothetical protein LEP1GSC038_1959 [Leptospira weilii str. 2006001855]|uniref:Uncharacterized protein n=1 Tax=Leptospira weilii str. 2006001855 TaxID=996804 RepID=M6FIW1_9LEPT|nr:hypothetical protein LEP1GSC038_1959 [Leptospira weilii str. 2006001855]
MKRDARVFSRSLERFPSSYSLTRKIESYQCRLLSKSLLRTDLCFSAVIQRCKSRFILFKEG